MENETKNIFDKRIIKNKIPKCKKSVKNIPFPNNIYSKNIKSLLPIRQSSTMSLKENTNLSQKYPSEKNFQMVNKKGIFSSLQRGPKNKIPKFNFNKRQNSWEKSKFLKINDDSFKKIKIEQIHNYKIQYLLLKEKIKNFSNQENISLDIKNKIIQEITLKLNLILKKSNQYLEEQNDENEIIEKNNNMEYNKKILNIYTEKYKNWNIRLREINNNKYISYLNSQINEIDKEINLYEKENEELLLNNNKDDIILPNIQKIKIEQDSILGRQLQNKILEYKEKIRQELTISKKIKDNEISIKRLEEIINNLNDKTKGLIDNSRDENYTEENNFNLDFLNFNKDLFKVNKKRKFSKLNELITLRNGSKKDLNNTTSANKDSINRIITSENQSNLEENIYMIPFTTKRKNLSCSNITIMDNETTVNNNKTIKEIILQNLDLKEKEEKSLINVYENGNNSLKKYKHIKLKPNFSFTNDYHKFKDDNINKYKKMQSSAEIANVKNDEENTNTNKEDLIKESVADESTNKKDIQNIPSIEKNSKFNRNKRLKDYSMDPIKKIFNDNTKINADEDIKKERFSTTTEQREKVLNTIMYDDL